MAYSYVIYLGNGTQRDYTVTFPYISREHVKIYVDSVQQTITWLSDSVIRITIPPTAGATILIQRVTPTDEKLVDFANGGRFSEDDLDIITDQMLYAFQEDLESRSDDLVNYTSIYGDVQTLKAQVQTSVKYLKDYANLATAVATIGSTKCTLVVQEAANLTANVTIPATMTLEILSGGSIVQTAAYTLTINGQLLAPMSQVFVGFSAGQVSGISESRPEYFGTGSAAFDCAIASSSLTRLSGGTYTCTLALTALDSNKTILGSGMNNTILSFTGSSSETGMLNALNKSGLEVRDLTISVNDAGGNRAGIKFDGCNGFILEHVKVTGAAHGFYFLNTAAVYTSNRGNSIMHCQAISCIEYGFNCHKMADSHWEGNYAYGTTTNDGFKFQGLNKNLYVIGNFSGANGRDGFDLYDGFIESIFVGNIADGNTYNGFDVKGTSDGTDFVVRDSLFSGNLATSNGTIGFAISSVRNATFTGNKSFSNTTNGFELNTVQTCSFAGNHASRNTQSGFKLLTVSRCNFTGDQATDNSWVDGTTQNGTYHGFNLADSGCDLNTFTGIIAQNGTTTGQLGGQGYGVFFATGALGNVIHGSLRGNVTGAVNLWIGNHISIVDHSSNFLLAGIRSAYLRITRDTSGDNGIKVQLLSSSGRGYGNAYLSTTASAVFAKSGTATVGTGEATITFSLDSTGSVITFDTGDKITNSMGASIAFNNGGTVVSAALTVVSSNLVITLTDAATGAAFDLSSIDNAEYIDISCQYFVGAY